MVKKMPDRKYAYFRDDQILFLVTHEANQVPADQLDDFQKGMSQFLKGRKIMVRPQAFSFPALTVEDREQRVADLHELEIKARDEELNTRQKELEKLLSLIKDEGSKDDPVELRNIKKSWTDEDRQKLIDEVQRRQTALEQRKTSAYEQPKLFETPFSLLECELDIASADLSPISLLEIVQSLRKSLKEELKDKTFGIMKVEDVSPNWLMSVSSQGGATGGPGALPMPFKEERGGPPLYDFKQLKDDLENAGLYNQGAKVDVAILDTAPCAHELVLAVKEWPDHHLIKSLLGPSGKLTLYPATYKALLRMASTSINQHDYPMPNHGLFAAGIVHSIVPQAQIHLIEVLNEFGVGDLASLAEGLALAYDQIYAPKSGRRLLVNCSWMLELPLSYLHCSAPESDVEHDFEEAVLRFVEEEREQALTLRTICNNLAVVGGVVAAAGNDKVHAKGRRDKKLKDLKQSVIAENPDRWIEYLLEYMRGEIPEARYPAAFASVVGVGALPKGEKRTLPAQKYEPSNYSNLGDKPAGDAIMTLGGEEGEDNQKKNKGVLGLYLGEKFPRVKNDPFPGQPHKREIEMYEMKKADLWAWWAGTSFAAPILTGAIAAVFGTGIRRTKEAVEALKSKHIIELDGTTADEDIMYVKQG